MDIDAVIAEGQETLNSESTEEATPEVQEEAQEVEETPVEESEEQESEVDDDAEEAEKKDGDVPFPKKAVNALSKKNKTITKLKARLEELEREKAEFEAKREATKQPQPEALNADDYETYDEYIKAIVEQQTRATTAQQANESQEATLKQQTEAVQQEYLAVREEEIGAQAQALMAEVPDMAELLQQHGQVFDTMPESIAQIFYEIDNAPAAAYVLAKEGKLQGIGRMPLAVAAAEIVRAQDKFEQYKPKPKQTTNAPTPMKAARAKGGSPTKRLGEMSTEELMKWSKGR